MLLCPWDFPGKNTGLGCHFLLQGIFLNQRLNLHLWHWQVDSLPLSYQGSPLLLLLLNSTSIRHFLQTALYYQLTTILIYTKIFLVVSTKIKVLISYKWQTRAILKGDAGQLSRVLHCLNHSHFYTSSKWLWFKFIPQQYDTLYKLWSPQGRIGRSETGTGNS